MTPPLLLALAGLAAPAPAPPVELDFQAVLGAARRESPLILAAREKVNERQGEVVAVRAQALPRLDVNHAYSRTRDVSMLLGSFSEMGSAFGFDPVGLIKPFAAYSTQASLSQTLFAFGKIRGTIAMAGLAKDEAVAASGTAERDLLHQVALQYLGCLSAQADLEVAEARQQAAHQFLEDMEARLSVQDARQLDVQRAKAERLAARTEVIRSESAWRRALETLNGQIGRPAATPLRLAPLPEAPGTETDGERQPERSELRQLQLQSRLLDQNAQVIRADRLPRVDLKASYGYLAGDRTNLFHQPYNAWNVTLSVKVPVFDGLETSGRAAQNRARQAQVKHATVDLQRQIDVELASARRELVKAVSFRETAEEAHAASLEALRTSQESFQVGLISSLDLLQARREERQAEATRRKAGLGVWQARFALQRALGDAPSLPR